MKKNNAFVLRKIYGKKILMPVKKNDVGDTPMVLNDTAADVWQLIDEVPDKDTLLIKMCSLYHVKEDSHEAMLISDFINSLLIMNLIVE